MSRDPYGDEHYLLSREPDESEAETRKRLNAYTPPAPPPADMPVELAKWRALDRRTRRALLREHKRVTGG